MRRISTAMLLTCLFCGCFGLSALVISASAADDAPKEVAMVNVKALLSPDASARDLAVDAILRERSTLVRQLIEIAGTANSATSEESRCAAIYLLGELRAPEAVPILAEILKRELGPARWSTFGRCNLPVFTALTKIGRPAIPAMIENIEKSDDPVLQERSLDVLYNVIGGKRRLVELLEKLGERADPETTKRFQKASVWANGHYKESEEPLY